MTKIHTNLLMRLAPAVAAMALFGTIAHAQGFMPWTDILQTANTNRDAGVTMEEVHSLADREKQFAGFAPWMKEQFKTLDANRDGMVSMDEIKRWMIGHNVSNDQLTQAWYEAARS